MNLDWKKIAIALGIFLALIIVALAAWRWLGSSATPAQNSGSGSFGTAPNIQVSAGGGTSVARNLPVFSSNESGSAAQQPALFKISDGPTVAAILLQTKNPTTTLARYVTGDNGHVLQVLIDASNETPTILSNTTIPGVERALWVPGGTTVILQYLDQGALKSVSLGLPNATTSAASTTVPNTVHFLPDNILALAASPTGSNIAYLLQTSSGASGYTAKPDGSNTAKLFSLPLSELTLSWPNQNTLLVGEKPASGIPGIVFSVNAKTGVATPLLYGNGLTALLNSDGTRLLYQTDDGATATTYLETLPPGASALLNMPAPLAAPLPEQCVWGSATSTSVYCAAPTGTLPGGYLDSWLKGEASVADALVNINLSLGSTTALLTPGTGGQGEPADMVDLSLSPDGTYLSFIAKDDETLWGVHLQ